MGSPIRGQEPAIQTRGLSCSFGSLVAVNKLNLTVAPGTFLGFLGANGAGKSTTTKMLTGLLRPRRMGIPSCNSVRLPQQDIAASHGPSMMRDPAWNWLRAVT